MKKRKSERRFVVVSCAGANGYALIMDTNKAGLTMGYLMTEQDTKDWACDGYTICELVPVKRRVKQKEKAKR